MSSRKILRTLVSVGFLLGSMPAKPARADSVSPNLGRMAMPAEIARWDISIAPDGKTLPKGRGSVTQGKEIYAEQCELCHGRQASGGPIKIPLVGGIGTLASPSPVRTVTSYWPYATTLFDYIRRAMPFFSPQSLTDSQVYAVSAYILSLDGIVAKNATLDRHTLPGIKMPNRNGFIPAWTEPR